METPANLVTAEGWARAHKWALAVTGALLLILYATNFVKLFGDWTIDPNYSHGFFVPLAFFWMLNLRTSAQSSTATRTGWLNFASQARTSRSSTTPKLWYLCLMGGFPPEMNTGVS